MECYIDFDNTLYNTSKLKQNMIEVISKTTVKQNSKLQYDIIFAECTQLFCKEKIYNIYNLCDFIKSKYGVNAQKLKQEVNNVIKNGKKFVFDDSVEFLLDLIKNDIQPILLTYTDEKNMEYQKRKIKGSGLSKFFKQIIYTTTNKFSLNLNYKNSIFIDDNPAELIGLSNTNPLQIIRVKREGVKYSLIKIDNKNIIEVSNLKELSNLKSKELKTPIYFSKAM